MGSHTCVLGPRTQVSLPMPDVPVPTLVGESVVVEADGVRILDRRVFPFERCWVVCRSVEDVAKAIEDMVTQSLGPPFAAAGGMVLAARSGGLDTVREAAQRLVATRPTNNGIRDVVAELLAVAEAGGDVERAAGALTEGYRAGSGALGEHAGPLIRDGAPLLPHCGADASLPGPVAAVLRAGRRIQAISTETRPYL